MYKISREKITGFQVCVTSTRHTLRVGYHINIQGLNKTYCYTTVPGVRGFYSANMTLGVTSMDSELDITGEDSLEDVDASCLMSAVSAPSSTSTIPVRKGRSKKTATTTDVKAVDLPPS